ncbi:MAG: hypothetical protein KDC05_01895 [Bacteroidales bacterium]|nr:hypothetical protein [Bacteroidales bacterium]
MKNLLLLLLTFGCFTVNFAQGQEHLFDEDEPEHICKFYHKDLPSPFESIINPNPLVNLYDVKFYKLDLEAYDTTNQFSGNAIVFVQVSASEMDTFSIELSHKLSADSVFINGNFSAFNHIDDNIFVTLDSPASEGDYIEFKLFYHTPVDYSSIYYSASQHATYGNFPVSQTFSEPYFAHEWMPMKQELHDKADSVHIFITTNSNLKVAGPGLLTEVPLPNNKVRHEWRTNLSTAFYLIFFAVSDYEEYNIYAKPDSLPNDSILIQNYLFDYPGILADNKTNIDYTADMIEQLSNQLGLFPFYKEKYGHYMWYPANFSGMEHITMSGMRGLGFLLISHELGHSWFGDNVTCATWSDVWINEGFATYIQYLVREGFYGKADADNQIIAYQNYAMTSSGGSVYVPESSLDNWSRIFSTRLSYRKGSAVVHMIRYMMNNDSLFFKTLYEFQQQYADSVATGADFRDKCQEISGIDFTHFFDQWYYGEGYPIYDLTWWQDADTAWLEVSQSTSSAVTLFFEIPVEFKLYFAGGDSVLRFDQLQNDTVYRFVFDKEITFVDIDPGNYVMNKIGNVKHKKLLDLKVFLEGPFGETGMYTDLNPEFMPPGQPFNNPPWNYAGEEMVDDVMPGDITDWVLITLYDTTSASASVDEAAIGRIAALLHGNGTITGMDGHSKIGFDTSVDHDLFLSIHHRNHLPVLTSGPPDYDKGVYSWDFSSEAMNAYGGADAQKEIAVNTWGMVSGDVNADGIVDETDKSGLWDMESGTSGYKSSDTNMDGQSDNQDKDEFWYPNLGRGTQLP